jgi:hypothetical protein
MKGSLSTRLDRLEGGGRDALVMVAASETEAAALRNEITPRPWVVVGNAPAGKPLMCGATTELLAQIAKHGRHCARLPAISIRSIWPDRRKGGGWIPSPADSNHLPLGTACIGQRFAHRGHHTVTTDSCARL